ncbi:hypothetical protein D3C81_1829270 [compost metagenome]
MGWFFRMMPPSKIPDAKRSPTMASFDSSSTEMDPKVCPGVWITVPGTPKGRKSIACSPETNKSGVNPS